MTPEELKIVEGKFLESKKTLFIICLAFGVGFLIFSYIIFFYFQLNESNWYLKFLPAMVLVLDISVIYFAIYPPYSNFKADFENKQKEIVNSQIEKTEERPYKNSISYYWILKNKQKLSVDASQYLSYKTDEVLVFHIAPKSKILLSVEKMGQF
jgi:hypothetical protein